MNRMNHMDGPASPVVAVARSAPHSPVPLWSWSWTAADCERFLWAVCCGSAPLSPDDVLRGVLAVEQGRAEVDRRGAR